MSSDPLSPGAPEPRGPDGDAKEPTAEVVADAFVDDVVTEKQNDALDALVARDRELVASELTEATDAIAEAKRPETKATKAQEWTAAVVLMAIVAAVCFALMTFFRS